MHIALHFLVPGLAARLFWPRRWLAAFAVMAATMLVDLDHLLASPIYDAQRCSIGFHPLHQFWPLLVYGLLCLVPALRWVGLGLVIHMVLDTLDCVGMPGGAAAMLEALWRSAVPGPQ